MNYIAIISVLVVIIMFLLYVSTSNKGWNCTENGCVYVSGGSFGSYDKCNSYCKSNSKLSNINNSNNNLPESDNTCGGVVANPMVFQTALQAPLQAPLQHVYPPISPYAQPPYGYYHPSLYYNDYNNHWRRGEKHHHHKDSGTKNHNENNIIINSPTGPN